MKNTTLHRRKTATRLRVLRAQLREVERLFVRLSEKHQQWKARR